MDWVVHAVPNHLRTSCRIVLSEQRGVVTTDQLIGFGLTFETIRANIDARRWQRVLRGVYATFTGQLDRAAQLIAALLYAGPTAVLSHHTAAEEWGVLQVGSDPTVHVTVPYSCSAISQPPLVAVHRSRAFRHIVVPGRDLQRTRLADTLIDVAAAELTPTEARHRFVMLVNAAPVRLTELHERLIQRPPRRFRQELKAALELVAGGSQSALEAEYVMAVERAHQLPAAQQQTPVTVDGRALWEDATYDHIGVPLTVRLDGRQYHSTPGAAFRDRRRDNAAELAGRARLIYGWREVSADPCGIADEIHAVLHRHGWPGAITPCPRCPRL